MHLITYRYFYQILTRVMLPAGLDTFNKTKWQRGGGYLPGVAAPLNGPDEAAVVTCLVEELSDRLALHLDNGYPLPQQGDGASCC